MAGLEEGGRAGRGGVVETLHRQAGQSELLHHAHAGHDRREDLRDVGGVHLVETDAGVLHRGETGDASHVGVARVGEHPEGVHADPEDGDVVELGLSHRAPPAATAGRKRRMTTSVSPSSRIDSSSATSGMPTENSSCLPASGTWTRGPSGRSIWPTP